MGAAMDELFGIPTDRLTLVLLVIFMIGALTLAFLAARDRTSFRMAARNIPRRKAYGQACQQQECDSGGVRARKYRHGRVQR